MIRSLSLFVCVEILFLTYVFLRAPICVAQSPSELIKVVESVEQAFRGLTITYKSTLAGRDEPEWMASDGSGETLSELKLSQNPSGHFLRFYRKNLRYPGRGETIKTANDKLFRVIDSGGISVSANPQYSDDAFFHIDTFALTGVSFMDRANFSHLLRDPSMKLALETTVLNGHDCQLLRGKSEILGGYDCWVASQGEPRVLKIEIRKSGQHRITDDFGSALLRDPPKLNPQVAKGMSVADLATYHASVKNASRTARHNEIYLFENYEQKMGRSFPTFVKFSSTTWLEDGRSSFYGATYAITGVETFEIDDPNRAIFKSIPVPNGTSVDVIGQEGLAWKYEDGTLVRVVDSDAIGSLNGVRFRKPTSSWPFYLGLTVLVSVFFWILYRRWLKES